MARTSSCSRSSWARAAGRSVVAVLKSRMAMNMRTILTRRAPGRPPSAGRVRARIGHRATLTPDRLSDDDCAHHESHRLTRLRLFALIGLIVVATVGALLVLVPLAGGRLDVAGIHLNASPSPEVANIAMQSAPPPPTLKAGPVANPTGMYEFGWALLDRRTNQVAGSANKDTMTNTTESMVKAWLAADYLRPFGPKQPPRQA